MSTEQIGALLEEVGRHVAIQLGRTPNDVFVFLEAGDQWQGGAVFENLDDRVIYHDPSPELIELVERMWEAAEPGKKWSIILYDIKDGRFEAEFMYTSDLEHHPFEHDYREDALVARYGSKTIVYPEPEGQLWQELTEEDLPEIEIIDEASERD